MFDRTFIKVIVSLHGSMPLKPMVHHTSTTLKGFAKHRLAPLLIGFQRGNKWKRINEYPHRSHHNGVISGYSIGHFGRMS